jgi:hypothetical protein
VDWIQGPVAVCCQHGSEHSSFIKVGTFCPADEMASCEEIPFSKELLKVVASFYSENMVCIAVVMY